MVKILAACEEYPDNYGRTGQQGAKRLRAFVLLLRYSGMRIGDTAACATAQVKGDRLFLYTQKTGVPVNAKLPPFVVEALCSVPPVSSRLLLLDGRRRQRHCRRELEAQPSQTFDLAGVRKSPSPPIPGHVRGGTSAGGHSAGTYLDSTRAQQH